MTGAFRVKGQERVKVSYLNLFRRDFFINTFFCVLFRSVRAGRLKSVSKLTEKAKEKKAVGKEKKPAKALSKKEEKHEHAEKEKVQKKEELEEKTKHEKKEKLGEKAEEKKHEHSEKAKKLEHEEKAEEKKHEHAGKEEHEELVHKGVEEKLGEEGEYKPKKKAKKERKPEKKFPVLKPGEVEETIVNLANAGHTASEIGLLLKEEYGIKKVKVSLKKTVGEVLGEHKLLGEVPEDLLSLVKKSVNVKNHLGKNPKDMSAKRGYQLTVSKIRRLAKYYIEKGRLPGSWKYSDETAKLLVK